MTATTVHAAASLTRATLLARVNTVWWRTEQFTVALYIGQYTACPLLHIHALYTCGAVASPLKGCQHKTATLMVNDHTIQMTGDRPTFHHQPTVSSGQTRSCNNHIGAELQMQGRIFLLSAEQLSWKDEGMQQLGKYIIWAGNLLGWNQDLIKSQDWPFKTQVSSLLRINIPCIRQYQSTAQIWHA